VPLCVPCPLLQSDFAVQGDFDLRISIYYDYVTSPFKSTDQALFIFPSAGACRWVFGSSGAGNLQARGGRRGGGGAHRARPRACLPRAAPGSPGPPVWPVVAAVSSSGPRPLQPLKTHTQIALMQNLDHFYLYTPVSSDLIYSPPAGTSGWFTFLLQHRPGAGQVTATVYAGRDTTFFLAWKGAVTAPYAFPGPVRAAFGADLDYNSAPGTTGYARVADLRLS
jgi:hypothetical protein